MIFLFFLVFLSKSKFRLGAFPFFVEPLSPFCLTLTFLFLVFYDNDCNILQVWLLFNVLYDGTDVAEMLEAVDFLVASVASECPGLSPLTAF